MSYVTSIYYDVVRPTYDIVGWQESRWADTPITSVTSPASLRHPESTFNQVMSLELSPALRAIHPDSSTEQSSSGIEGDGLLQLERDLPAWTAVTDTPSSLNDGDDGHEMESPAHAVEKIPACLKKTLRNQKANQRLGSEGVGSKDTIKRCGIQKTYKIW